MLLTLAIVLLLALAFAQATRSGGSITRHPYFRRFSDAPGARSSVSGREGIARMSSRGTR